MIVMIHIPPTQDQNTAWYHTFHSYFTCETFVCGFCFILQFRYGKMKCTVKANLVAILSNLNICNNFDHDIAISDVNAENFQWHH